MRKIRIEAIIPILFLLFAAFVVGFVAPDVRASGGNVKSWVASLQLLPQRLENISNSQEDKSESRILPLIGTYSSVIEQLKEDYYCKNPDQRVKKLNEQDLTYNAIRGMLLALGDPFTRFMDPDDYTKMREENEGNFTGIGARLDTNKNDEVYIKEPLKKSPAFRAGVKSNDVIIAVDGKKIKGMDINDVVKLIRGKEGTKVKLTLRRPSQAKLLTIMITRKIVNFEMVESRMLDDKAKIGYVRLYQFNEQSDTQFNQALTDLDKGHMKGLIFDLRGNPGGLLNIAVDIGSRFIESGPVVIIQERGGQKDPLYVEEDRHNHKRYPLVVLVDEWSASASEIVSGAIKDDGAGTLVGTTTFGKGRVQTIMPMEDGSAVAITTAKYLTPNGIDIHKKGIAPDVYVQAADNFDPNDPKTDVQLAKGVEVLKVKMGLLPQSVLDKLQKTAKAKK